MLVLLLAPPAGAQAGLTQAAARARADWIGHRATALLAGSPGVILQIPGADPSSAIGREQAAALLARYLRTAAERSVDIATVREVEEGRGYVELVRRYQVAGTTEERHETVYLGFQRRGPEWVVVELRIAP
jgi:hypothetical protein